MRFIKPFKGFRLCKVLGTLFFAAAFFSGHFFSPGSSYAQETPFMNEEEREVYLLGSFELPEEIKNIEPAKKKKSEPIPFKEQQLPDVEPNAEVGDLSILETGAETPERMDSKAVVTEVKPGGVEIRAEIAPKVEAEPIIDQEPTYKANASKGKQPEKDKQSLQSTSSNVVSVKKQQVLPEKRKEPVVSRPSKFEKPSKLSKKNHNKVTRRAVATVEDDSVMPEGIDWFSYPLVFKTDENGKRILVADKTAPKIVIPTSKNKKSYKKSNKKAEQQKNSKLEEKRIEPKPMIGSQVEQVAIAEELESKPEERAGVSLEERGSASGAKDGVAEHKPLYFRAAAEKMARIKRLHMKEDVIKAKLSSYRSPSMLKLRSYLIELINKKEALRVKTNESLGTSVVPHAPPEYIEAEELDEYAKLPKKAEAKACDSTTVAQAETKEPMTFKPYIGLFRPSRLDYSRLYSSRSSAL